MPCGALNEYSSGDSWLCRANTARISEYTSVIVPTVERAFPPSGRWSTITGVVRFSIASTCGRSYLGRKFSTNTGNVAWS
jgi:hypothetical protein